MARTKKQLTERAAKKRKNSEDESNIEEEAEVVSSTEGGDTAGRLTSIHP